MTSNIAGVNNAELGQNALAQRYASMIQAGDFAGSASSGISAMDTDICNPFGMQGSLFSGGMGYGMGMGMGYGYSQREMQMMNNMTSAEYSRYQALENAKLQEELEDGQMERAVRRKHKYETAGFKANAAEDVIARQISTLQHKIKDNEQDHIRNEYARLLESVREKFKEAGYTHPDENQVKAYAEKLYAEHTGSNLLSDIENNGNGEFVHGLKQGAFGVGWLFTNNNGSKDTVSNITGEQKSLSDKAAQVAGIAISALATFAVGAFVLRRGGNIRNGLKNIKASYTGWQANRSLERIAANNPGGTYNTIINLGKQRLANAEANVANRNATFAARNAAKWLGRMS